MSTCAGTDPVVGLLLVSAEGVRLDEWRRGSTEEVRAYRLGEPMRNSHELLGPAASHPKGAGEGAPAFRSSQQRDLYEARLEKHRVALVRDVAAEAAATARARGWALVLVLGDPRLATPATDVLDRAGVPFERSSKVLGWMTHHRLASAVAGEIEQALARVGA